MDFFFKHWAGYPRSFPSPCPVQSMGDFKEKDHRTRATFQSCNFSFILRGSGDFNRAGRQWTIQAPFVLTQWPGEPLEYGPKVPDETWDELYLIYDAPCLPWFRARGYVEENRPVWPIHNLEGVMAQVEELRALSRDPIAEFTPDRIDRVCERLILESLLADVATPDPATDRVIRRIAGQLQQKPHLPHDLDRIARQHGLSPSTFRRRWFEALKTTPGRYLSDLRLQSARRLLAETDLPVGEVAAHAGFQDAFYFSRRFRSETGLTPSQYRKRYRIGTV